MWMKRYLSPRTNIRRLHTLKELFEHRHQFREYLTQKELLANGEYWQGSVQPCEEALLQQLVQEAGALPGPIVEIGTLFGFSTMLLAAWKSPQQTIITVDNYSWNPWGLSHESHFELTRRILRYFIETGQVLQVRMDKDEFYRKYEGGAPALVFLDAIHTCEATRSDIQWALSVKAGVIVVHDYSDEWPGVIQAVDQAGGPRRLSGSLCSLT